MRTERKRVWLASWSMECCGEPFAVGSTVEWVLCPVSDSRRRFFRSVFGENAAERITDTEEGHGGVPDDVGRAEVTGVVRSIERVAWILQPHPEDLPMSQEPEVYAVPGSVVVEARSSAEVWEGTATSPPRHGWLVNLDVSVACAAND